MILRKYQKIKYSTLHAKAKEAYNFQKASAILADYGFVTNLLKYDWVGADFLAQHIDGDWLKIQLKGRLTADLKYCGKDIHILFEHKTTNEWFLYPHDSLVDYCKKKFPNSAKAKNGYSTGRLSEWEKKWLEQYKIPS
jgi:hypothetical protein